MAETSQTPSMRSSRALELATSPQIVRLALRTSVLVGSVLNLINQGDALFGSARLDLFKLALTYVVPYCVATYSATSVMLRQHGRDSASAEPLASTPSTGA